MRWPASLLSVLLATAMTVASAADFPDRPVKIIVPYSPGGGTDIMARTVAQKLGEYWKQTVFVENRPGANGIIGSEGVAKAAPDGTTLLVVVPAHLINPNLVARMPFDPVEDFAAVTNIARAPWMIVANASFEPKTLKEMIDYAKANPGKLSFGSSEPSSQLAGVQFQQLANVSFTHVPYKGGAQIMADLLGGHVSLGFTSPPTISAHYKSGKAKVLAIASKHRDPAYPDVPTAEEAGLPGYESSVWYGMYAPKGTPPAILEKIQQDIARAVGTKEVRDQISALGAESVANSPAEFARFTQSEFKRLGKLAKDSGMKPE